MDLPIKNGDFQGPTVNLLEGNHICWSAVVSVWFLSETWRHAAKPGFPTAVRHRFGALAEAQAFIAVWFKMNTTALTGLVRVKFA